MEVESGVTTAHGLYMDHAFQANHVRAARIPEFVYQLLKWMDEEARQLQGRLHTPT